MAQGGKERITEELLDQLLASSTPEAYLASEGTTIERDLPDYLNELLESRGIRRSDVVRASGLNATVVYDIFSGKSRPGHDHAVMLAFGLGCNLREAQRLLRLAGVSELWCKVPRDAILIWCFEHGLSLDGRPVCGFAARRFSRQLKIYRPAALKLKYRRRVLLLWGCPWCAKKDGRF